MRPRERILANLESIYRESYDHAQQLSDKGRMSTSRAHTCATSS